MGEAQYNNRVAADKDGSRSSLAVFIFTGGPPKGVRGKINISRPFTLLLAVRPVVLCTEGHRANNTENHFLQPFVRIAKSPQLN